MFSLADMAHGHVCATPPGQSGQENGANYAARAPTLSIFSMMALAKALEPSF
jgi:hypothetical protein